MTPQNILILTYWSYPDALIQTYTLPYVRIIRKSLPVGSVIYLLTLESEKRTLEKSKNESIASALKAEGIEWLPFAYKPFGLTAFLQWIAILLRLSSLILSKKISTIHCWCTPAGAIGYLLSIFLNRRLILDSFEPHAEAMVENGTWLKDSIAFRLLFWLEKKQAKRASCTIAATHGMQDYAKTKYGVHLNNFYVKPACVDLNLFSEDKIKDFGLLEQLGFNDKVVCVYAGKFGGIYLDREVFQFLRVAYNYWGDRFRVLLLSSADSDEVKKYCLEAGLPLAVVTKLFVPHEQVPKYIGVADFALCPVKPLPSKRYCTPIKNGEYWALGLPVVIPAKISDDASIIEENKIGVVLYGLDNENYLNGVKKIAELMLVSTKQRIRVIRKIAETYRGFEIAEAVYEKIYGQYA